MMQRSKFIRLPPLGNIREPASEISRLAYQMEIEITKINKEKISFFLKDIKKKDWKELNNIDLFRNLRHRLVVAEKRLEINIDTKRDYCDLNERFRKSFIKHYTKPISIKYFVLSKILIAKFLQDQVGGERVTSEQHLTKTVITYYIQN